ncbi:MAG TPA: FAD-dependent oxidoreductase [Baekduia sp.]|nr:FAD-dependent oxidoreductase [Baekduia sp.]
MSGAAAHSADIVVIGGGIMGAATALHLQESGAGSVLLLERDQLGQGTSSAGAGMVGVWAAGLFPFWGAEEAALETYAFDFYKQLAEQSDDFRYRANGNLWLSTSEEDWVGTVEPMASNPLAKNREKLSPQEVHEITNGLVDPKCIVGGVLDPAGIHMTAGAAARAVGRRFEEAGGRVRTHTPVTGLRTAGSRISGVETIHGHIDCGAVVVAGGAWTNKILRSVDVWLPLVPLMATRLTTSESVGAPTSMPNVSFNAEGFYFREHDDGALLWGSDYEVFPRYSLVDVDPPDRFTDVPLNGVVELQRLAQSLAAAVPAIAARSQEVKAAHGAPCHTPDLKFLAGPVGIDGLYAVSGDNEGGVTHGPGLARMLTEYIVGAGQHVIDPTAYDPNRFGDRYTTARAVADAVGENFKF